MSAIGRQSATVASVDTSTTVATLLAASATRIAGIIVNEAAAVLYVKFGTVATSTDYTYAIPAGGTMELPQPAYGGIITGILAAGAAASKARTTVY